MMAASESILADRPHRRRTHVRACGFFLYAVLGSHHYTGSSVVS